MPLPIISVSLDREPDVVTARKLARQIASELGFDTQDSTRISTAVSEIARNAFTYGGGGKVEFEWNTATTPGSLIIRVSDQGPGIENLSTILSGRYQSTTGMGLGMIGSRRLMDRFEVDTTPGRGTTITIAKQLPRNARAIGATQVAAVTDRIAHAPQNFYDEVRVQNQELLKLLAELRERQEDLARVNRELEDTNRGVMALYAELDDRAERLRQADQVKSRFLSYVSHEFRTPLNGIIGLTRLLMTRAGREEEDVKQIKFIQRSAEELTEMVNDLLDLAKVEAGKLTVHAMEFDLESLFGALRGMFRPLTTDAVRLTIDTPDAPPLFTDESKLSQILRNFISNALKFTEAGEVRVMATYDRQSDTIALAVKDTGIGIAAESQSKIFEEFAQLDSLIQRRVKGTGLGLPLCKRLAELLGGEVRVHSEPGVGSTFTAVIPRAYGPVPAVPVAVAAEPDPPPVRSHSRALLIDDDDMPRYLLRQALRGPEEIIEAPSGEEGVRRAVADKPDIIFLDLTMPGMSGFDVLRALDSDPTTRSIPVVIVTGQVLSASEVQLLMSRALAILSKEAFSRPGEVRVDFGPPVAVLSRFPNEQPVV